MQGVGVDKPHVFGVGGACRVEGHHRVHFVPHHEESVVVSVFRVGGVVCELSACKGRLALLLATLCLIVAKLATISALGRVVLSAWSGMVALPST